MFLSKENVLIIVVTLAIASGVFVANAGYYKDAYDAFKAKNYTSAAQILEEGVAAAPNDENLYNLLGQTYLRLKQYNKAIDAFTQTTLLDPEIDSAHHWLGISYTMKTEDGKRKPAWFEASQAFKQATKLVPDNSKYLYYYGHSLLELGKFQEAVEPLENAFKTPAGAKNYKVVMDLGLAMQLNSRKEDALQYLEKAHEIKPDEYQPLKHLGNLYLEMQNYDKVKAVAVKLMTLRPDDSSSFFLSGMAQLHSKNYSQARTTFEKVTEMDPKNDSAYYHLGLALEGLLGSHSTSFRKLIDTYGKAINQNQNPPAEWHYRLGHAYELESQLDWDRSMRNEESRNRCLRNLYQAKKSFLRATAFSGTASHLATVKERIRRLETIQ